MIHDWTRADEAGRERDGGGAAQVAQTSREENVQDGEWKRGYAEDATRSVEWGEWGSSLLELVSPLSWSSSLLELVSPLSLTLRYRICRNGKK